MPQERGDSPTGEICWKTLFTGSPSFRRDQHSTMLLIWLDAHRSTWGRQQLVRRAGLEWQMSRRWPSPQWKAGGSRGNHQGFTKSGALLMCGYTGALGDH